MQSAVNKTAIFAYFLSTHSVIIKQKINHMITKVNNEYIIVQVQKWVSIIKLLEYREIDLLAD